MWALLLKLERGEFGVCEIALAFMYTLEDGEMRSRHRGMTNEGRRMRGSGRSLNTVTKLHIGRDFGDVTAILSKFTGFTVSRM